MSVVVTGGAGFIGANLCRELVRRGPRRRGAGRPLHGPAANLDGVEGRLVAGSILDDAALDEALPGATSVVHLAARPVGAEVDHRPGGEPRGERHRHRPGARGAAAPRSRPRGGGVVLLGLRRQPGAAQARGPHPDAGVALRGIEAGHRAVRAGVGGLLRAAALAFRFFNVFGPLQPAGHDYAAVVPAFVDAAAGRPSRSRSTATASRPATSPSSAASPPSSPTPPSDRVAHDRPGQPRLRQPRSPCSS